MYLDSSGGPDWPPPWGNSQHQYYVISGLALTPKADYYAHHAVYKLLVKIFGTSMDVNGELHYGDLINKRPPYNILSDQERVKIADDVFNLIIKLKPIIFASVVDKIAMKKRYGERAFPVRLYAVRSIIHRFSMALQRKRALGHAVMDSEQYRTDKDIQAMIHEGRRLGMTIRGIEYDPKIESRLEHVLNSLTFSPSEMCPGIQLSDFVAYVVWSKYERNKVRRFLQIRQCFDHDDINVYEPCVIPRSR